MPEYSRILIIKPSSLGDIVHALPALQALRRRYPQAHLAWLVKRQWAGLLTRVDGLDAIWPVDPGLSGWLSQVPRLRAERFDAVVDLQGLFRSAAMGWLAGCAVRVGFADGREGSPLFYTHRVSVGSEIRHAIDRYLAVAARLWASGGPADPAPEPWVFGLRPQAADREAVRTLLARHGVSGDGTPWVAVNVSARWRTKRWPADAFAAALDELQETTARVAIVGGPDEREEAAGVIRLMKTVPADLTGAIPLELLPALLEAAAVVVTGDSGPMHLAAAVGTPVVGLFGPSSPAYSGPRGERHRVLTSDVPCRPCFSVVCRNERELECLRRISPAMVTAAVRDLLPARVAQR
ncbi:MAG: ADP-heptose--LPS heptosyltransferase [Nitrospiraceae bacterium]|nr:MAG: ADP-heptose--LPS heptosyltransferase [Nitrospiraceae bacterium]